MANLWTAEELEVMIEGKKQGLSNRDITEILHENFSDKYRTYNDSMIKNKWVHMRSLNPSLKKYSPPPGNKKGFKTPHYSPQEDKLIEALYLEGIPYAEMTKTMKEEFPDTRIWSNRIIESRISIKAWNNRQMDRKRPTIVNNLEELQSRCHPRMKVLSAINSQNVITECLDCGQVSSRQGSKLQWACGTCENKPDTPQDLYLIEFSDFDYPSCKIGISRDYYGVRSKDFAPHKQILVIHTIFKKAKKIEKKIKKEFEIYKTNPHELIENGHTECFDISLTEQIKNRIEELHG